MTDREEFLQIFRQHVTRPGSEKLLDWLDHKTDFFSAPASTRFHGACTGGLCMHSPPVQAPWNRVDAGAEKKSVLWSSQSSSFSLPGRVTCCRKICKNSSRSVMLTAPYLPGCP